MVDLSSLFGRPGDWRRASLTRRDTHVLVVAACLQALFRAFDYQTGQDSSRPPINTLSLLERAFPLWSWGLVLLAGVALLVYGERRRQHIFVWGGHTTLGICYILLMVGIALNALEMPWLNGIRGATVLILPVMLHGLLSFRTGPRPLTHDEQQEGKPL